MCDVMDYMIRSSETCLLVRECEESKREAREPREPRESRESLDLGGIFRPIPFPGRPSIVCSETISIHKTKRGASLKPLKPTLPAGGCQVSG